MRNILLFYCLWLCVTAQAQVIKLTVSGDTNNVVNGDYWFTGYGTNGSQYMIFSPNTGTSIQVFTNYWLAQMNTGTIGQWTNATPPTSGQTLSNVYPSGQIGILLTYWAFSALTNWVQATSNYWSYPGDIVNFRANGRNYSSGSGSNQLVVAVDGNRMFTGPWTSAGGYAWSLSGRVLWDGTNFDSWAHFESGDTNTPFFDDAEQFINVAVGTNGWSWIVLGDTNGLTFDAMVISAGRAPASRASPEMRH